MKTRSFLSGADALFKLLAFIGIAVSLMAFWRIYKRLEFQEKFNNGQLNGTSSPTRPPRLRKRFTTILNEYNDLINSANNYQEKAITNFEEKINKGFNYDKVVKNVTISDKYIEYVVDELFFRKEKFDDMLKKFIFPTVGKVYLEYNTKVDFRIPELELRLNYDLTDKRYGFYEVFFGKEVESLSNTLRDILKRAIKDSIIITPRREFSDLINTSKNNMTVLKEQFNKINEKGAQEKKD